MPQHALSRPSGGARRVGSALLAWHDARPRASFSDARGWMWAALVAATFFWMSNPLVFIPSFYLSLGGAIAWTPVVAVLSLPWLRLPRLPWPWLAFLGLGLLSQLWTIQPFYTDVSNTIYVEMAVVAFVTAANCEPVVVAWGMAAGGVTVVALSLYALHLGVAGIEYSSSTGMVFGGVGTNENILAYTLVVSLAATCAIGRPRGGLVSALWVTALLVQLYGIYRAGSGTGYLTLLLIAITVVSVLAWPLARRASRRGVLAVAGAGLATLAVGMLVITVVLGKELSSISGRAPFWQATFDSTMALVPWLGGGWGAVWEHPWDPAPPNHIAFDIYARAGYPLPHGHNFFVDVLPELGLVGCAIAVVMVAYAVREVRRSGLQPGSKDPLTGRLVLLVLVALLASGITEPLLTVPLGWWSFALVVTLSRQRQLPRQHGARTARPAGTRGRRVATRA